MTRMARDDKWAPTSLATDNTCCIPDGKQPNALQSVAGSIWASSRTPVSMTLCSISTPCSHSIAVRFSSEAGSIDTRVYIVVRSYPAAANRPHSYILCQLGCQQTAGLQTASTHACGATSHRCRAQSPVTTAWSQESNPVLLRAHACGAFPCHQRHELTCALHSEKGAELAHE